MNPRHPGRARSRWLRALALALVLAPAGPRAQPPIPADPGRELSAVRERIVAVERRIARQSTERDAGARELRELEVAIGASASKLETLRGELDTQEERARELAQEQRVASGRLAAERGALAAEARASYMAGREEVFKLVLSQQSPSDLGRMLAYFDYFNRARGRRIDAVAAELSRLAGLAADAQRVGAELARLETAQAAEVARLARAREERRELVASLDLELAAAGHEVERLRAEEQRLAELVKELVELLASFPAGAEEPFAKMKGKLAWPVPGRIDGDFGAPRDGGPMRWNGVRLESPAGTPVRAIYHGRIAFADWLTGLGLLIIVDHGDGYMSLYGYNEALLKEPGEWVAPGEAIARVGDSGGQARPALYFEIRANGEPISPHVWINGSDERNRAK